jgi:hypothetical protein
MKNSNINPDPKDREQLKHFLKNRFTIDFINYDYDMIGLKCPTYDDKGGDDAYSNNMLYFIKNDNWVEMKKRVFVSDVNIKNILISLILKLNMLEVGCYNAQLSITSWNFIDVDKLYNKLKENAIKR